MLADAEGGLAEDVAEARIPQAPAGQAGRPPDGVPAERMLSADTAAGGSGRIAADHGGPDVRRDRGSGGERDQCHRGGENGGEEDASTQRNTPDVRGSSL
ncbi:hypothetical protein GCM10014719_70620 [Planomonospora parontospora subsp. antibiotica]|nr:hypothetical protein GCM10014719_70620 [Planomonospora parontospora subsp. antibiotica]GII20292.1 hypothetical protein Ppa05_70180 [Planomonospora parontospora subsp. antibiotica]